LVRTDVGRPLVKMSTNWDVVGIWGTRTWPRPRIHKRNVDQSRRDSCDDTMRVWNNLTNYAMYDDCASHYSLKPLLLLVAKTHLNFITLLLQCFSLLVAKTYFNTPSFNFLSTWHINRVCMEITEELCNMLKTDRFIHNLFPIYK